MHQVSDLQAALTEAKDALSLVRKDVEDSKLALVAREGNVSVLQESKATLQVEVERQSRRTSDLEAQVRRAAAGREGGGRRRDFDHEEVHV